jgi:putative serine protease PepD
MSNDLFWPSDDEGDLSATRQLTPGTETPSEAVTTGDAEPRRRGRPTWLVPATAAGVAALVFGGVGVGVGVALDDGGGPASTGSGFTVTSASAKSAAIDPESYAGIATKVLPSVVSINVRGANTADTGSGVILRSDGYVLTNNHVVSAAADGGTVSVVVNDGSTASARIVGTDQEDDLAVIKVSRTGLPAATLGNSSALHVGDPVLAVGSPLGLSGTVTSGIVSALNRPVDTTSDQQNIDPFGQQSATTTVFNAIQTDAAINPGNSGGPLVDASGSVIGINSAIASTGSAFGGQSGNIGVGFAIPIDLAKVVAQQLIQTGHVSHPLMGVSLADATDSSGNDLARVQAVSSGGPADQAGVEVGDVIVQVGDQRTAGADAVIAAVRSHQPGDRVPVTVLRDGSRKTLTVKLVDASSLQG